MYLYICTYYARTKKMNISAVILPKKKNKSGKVNIKIRIVHKREVRDIGTNFYIMPTQWKGSKVDDDVTGADYINYEVNKTILGYQEKLLKANYRDLPISRIVEILREDKFINSDFLAYFRKVIEKKTKTNQRTGEIYQTTLDKIRNFDRRSVLLFEDISSGWLKDFEANMKQQGNKKATRSIHFRNIRTVFNDAIDHNEIDLSLYPFRRYQIVSGSDEKTPLTLSQLQSLIKLQLELPSHQNAQKVFLLSFCLIGINSTDLMELTQKSISSGRILYTRDKTTKPYSVKLEREALDLINQLRGEKRLLNLADRFKSVKTFTTSTNIILKKIGKQIGLPGLMVYTARHTWASLAKNLLGTEDNDISAALGHTIGGVTQTYIHRNQEFIDKINRSLLDKVFEVKPIRRKQKKETGVS